VRVGIFVGGRSLHLGCLDMVLQVDGFLLLNAWVLRLWVSGDEWVSMRLWTPWPQVLHQCRATLVRCTTLLLGTFNMYSVLHPIIGAKL